MSGLKEDLVKVMVADLKMITPDNDIALLQTVVGTLFKYFDGDMPNMLELKLLTDGELETITSKLKGAQAMRVQIQMIASTARLASVDDAVTSRSSNTSQPIIFTVHITGA